MLCEHNRDGDSHRSPWSGAYFPPLDDGFRPSERLRSLELRANEAFDVYRELYYGKATSVSSAYLWDKDEEDGGGATGEGGGSPGFAGCFLVRNATDDGGLWSSVHVVDAARAKGGKCAYKLTTTLLLTVAPPSGAGVVSGSLVRRNARERELPPSDVEGGHVANIGRFVEDVESEMRSEMDSLYIQKTRMVVEEMRRECLGATQGEEHTRVLNDAVLAMAVSRKANLGDGK